MHLIGEIALSWRAMLKGNRFEKLQIIFKLLINRFNLFLYELASKLYSLKTANRNGFTIGKEFG